MARKRGNGQGTLFQRKTGGAWIGMWYDQTGRRRTRTTGTTDRRAAERILAKFVADAALRREGVIDTRLEDLAQQGHRLIGEHLDDFKAALTAQGSTSRHVELVTARTERAIKACGFRTWADVSASSIMNFLDSLRKDQVKVDPATGKEISRKRGISAQTFNFYLQAVKQFARWMVKDRRVAESPLAHLAGLNVRTDRRHDRCALSADDLRALIDITEFGPIGPNGKRLGPPVRMGMSGPERAMLYRLAVETGLRAGELRSLTRASFSLDTDPPTVKVAAAYSKRRRDDTLPLRAVTANLLKVHLAHKALVAPAFKMPEAQHQVRMIRADLIAAGVAVQDAAGRVADFHALRHTFITNLAAGGVHPKTAQVLARHSTITLTMDRYTHPYAANHLAALDLLPNLSCTDIPRAAVGAATGAQNEGSGALSGASKGPISTVENTPGTVLENASIPAGICDVARSGAPRRETETERMGNEPHEKRNANIGKGL